MNKENKIKKLIKSGKSNLNKHQYYVAIEDFLEAQRFDKENPEINYLLGITNIRVERYKKAIKYLNRVLESDLTFINKSHAKMLLGYVYTINGDYEKALEMFNAVIKAGIESAQAFTAIGYIKDRLGEFKEAVMNLYRAIDIDPKNANAHNSLGYIFAEANVNLEEALEECRKAVSMDKNNPVYLDSLGWVYYKLGNINQAKICLKKALKGAPHNEEIKNHLYIVLNAVKDSNLD